MAGSCVDRKPLVPSNGAARRGGGAGGDGACDWSAGSAVVPSLAGRGGGGGGTGLARGGGGGGGTGLARGGGGGGGAERVVAAEGESSVHGSAIASKDSAAWAKHGVSATMSPPGRTATRGKTNMNAWVVVASMAAVLVIASTAGPKSFQGSQARAMSVQPKSPTSASTMASREPQRGVCSQRPM